MKIKINGKAYFVDRLSDLSFEIFNKVIIKAEALTLPEYLAVMTDLSIDEINRSHISTFSITYLDQMLLDIRNIQDVIKDKKDTLHFKDKIYLVDKLEFDTFGQSYIFESIALRPQINDFERMIYALSVALTKELDASKVEANFKELSKIKWMDVLPQGFFLIKKYAKEKLQWVWLLRNCIRTSRKMEKRMQTYQSVCERLERI